MATRVVGLDIGSTTVRAVEVENPNKAKPTVLRYHEVPLPEGAARSGEVLEPHTVASAIKTLWSSGGFTSKNVVLGIGNQRVLARDLTLPKMTPLQIRESLPFQVQDMLPIPVSEALLDFYPVSEGVADSGPVVNGLLVAAVKESVLANISAIKLAGLTAVEVDLIPFALTRVQTRTVSAQGAIALIDVGSATTTVVVAINGVPQFVRIIPTGGQDVTKAIAARLDLDESVAEQAKRALGLPFGMPTPEQRAVMEIIYEITTELLNNLRNTISYYDNTHDTAHVERIILSGGGSQLNGFANALSELTRIQAVAVDPFGGLTMGRKSDVRGEDAHGPMTVALGLALGSNA
jgi:type IV pilus assembly protein PilM